MKPYQIICSVIFKVLPAFLVPIVAFLPPTKATIVLNMVIFVYLGIAIPADSFHYAVNNKQPDRLIWWLNIVMGALLTLATAAFIVGLSAGIAFRLIVHIS